MATAKTTSTWSLIDYTDVWENEEEGEFIVNDQTVLFDDLVITDDASDQDILKYLCDIHYLVTDDEELVHLEDYGDGMIEIVDTEIGYPLGRLQKNCY